MNKLKQIGPGGPCLLGGTICAAQAPGAVHLMKRIGLSYVEMGASSANLTWARVSASCQLARALGIPPVVRLNGVDRSCLTLALDGGAMGVSVSGVSDLAAAQAVVTATRYAPLGLRGTAEPGPHNDYHDDPQDLAALNSAVHVALRLPVSIACEELSRIVATDGVDAVEFEGASVDDMETRLRSRTEIALQKGVLVCGTARKPDEIATLAAAGVQLIRYAEEAELLAGYFRRALQLVQRGETQRGAA